MKHPHTLTAVVYDNEANEHGTETIMAIFAGKADAKAHARRVNRRFKGIMTVSTKTVAIDIEAYDAALSWPTI